MLDQNRMLLLIKAKFTDNPQSASVGIARCLLGAFLVGEADLIINLPQAFAGVDIMMPCFYVALNLFLVSSVIAALWGNPPKVLRGMQILSGVALLGCVIASIVMAHLDSALYTHTMAYAAASSFGLLESLTPNEAIIVAGIIIGVIVIAASVISALIINRMISIYDKSHIETELKTGQNEENQGKVEGASNTQLYISSESGKQEVVWWDSKTQSYYTAPVH